MECEEKLGICKGETKRYAGEHDEIKGLGRKTRGKETPEYKRIK